MALTCAASATPDSLPLVEGADGNMYVLGELQLQEEARTEALKNADYKIQVASLKGAAPAVKTAAASGNCTTYRGIASVYGLNNGSGDSSTQALAGGGRLNVSVPSAAMKPPVKLHSTVKVVNKRNGKTINVKVNDRGPYVAGRIIDLSPAAARGLGFSGLTSVEVEVCTRTASAD
jgi:rare lipoprotein A